MTFPSNWQVVGLVIDPWRCERIVIRAGRLTVAHVVKAMPED